MLNSDGSIVGEPEILDAQVFLSLPIESEGEDRLRTLFDCVEEFHHRAQQRELFVYTVEYKGLLYEVDWADKTVKDITPEKD